jgi:hypothetical protein
LRFDHCCIGSLGHSRFVIGGWDGTHRRAFVQADHSTVSAWCGAVGVKLLDESASRGGKRAR